MTATRPRQVALEVITRVRARQAFAHETLSAVLSTEGLGPQDAAFATHLAYGTIACRGTLDEAVARFLAPGRALEPQVADALALSAYEILFSSTPARAAVSQGVELVRSLRPKATGLANALLRRLAESASDFPWGDPATDVGALARSLGHPEWLAQLWIHEIGHDDAARTMAANNDPAPLFLAILPFVSSIDGVTRLLAEEGAMPIACPLPGCIRADVPSAAVRSSALRDKAVLVADAGAQLAAHVMRPIPGQRIVELGAGRGTKTLIMAGIAHAAGGTAEIAAVDTHRFKLDVLAAAAETLGARGITTACADATVPGAPEFPPKASADAVLVDAPCSGLGTLRRHPDRRWRATPAEIETLAALGASLLDSAATLVNPGGFVVYSTCTIARRENAQVVEVFLASEAGRGFRIDPLNGDVPELWGRFVTPEGYFQSLPEVGGMDGHFIARLVRET